MSGYNYLTNYYRFCVILILLLYNNNSVTFTPLELRKILGCNTIHIYKHTGHKENTHTLKSIEPAK